MRRLGRRIDAALSRLGDRRPDGELLFVDRAEKAQGNLLLDTCTIIDQLQGKLPNDVAELIGKRRIFHSTIVQAELAFAIGCLDPAHPGTQPARNAILQLLESAPGHRLIAPARETLIEAGALAGAVARKMAYAKDDRRKIVNDAAIFLQAIHEGLVVLTGNIGDFDLLQQMHPSGRVIFYRK